jgi:large subunit ribosomal protein L17
MSHNVFGTKLSRDTDARQALLKGLAGALIRSESIETTEAKAKAARDMIEKLITHAKKASLSDIRQIEAVIVDKDLVEKLVHDIAPRFTTRSGGYLRLIKTGFRSGDNAPLVRMELVSGPLAATSLGNNTTKKAPKAKVVKEAKSAKSTTVKKVAAPKKTAKASAKK